MKNNKLRKLLPPLISLIVAIACGIGMIYLYKLTKYLPIYLLGLTLLLPSAVNFSLFILKIPTKKKEKKTPTANCVHGIRAQLVRNPSLFSFSRFSFLFCFLNACAST